MSALITGSARGDSSEAVAVAQTLIDTHQNGDYVQHSRMLVFETNWMVGDEVVGRATLQAQVVQGSSQLFVTLPLA